jgi:hypothetical protein
MIVLITRTYLTVRGYTPRALAALGVMAAVAACGGGSATPPVQTTSSPPAPANSSVTPTPSAGGGISESLINAPAGSTGSAHLDQQSSPTVKSASSHSLSTGGGNISQGAGGQITAGGSGSGVVSQATANGGSASKHSASSKKTPTQSASNTQTTATKTTPAQPPATTQTTPSKTITTTVTVPTAPPKTIAKTKTVYRNRVHTVVRVRTVTKTLKPAVPSTAFLPSKHPALEQSSFIMQGANVGCQIGPAGARCSVQQRVWAAPPQPLKCRTTWGDTISLEGHGPAKFVCGGRSGISANAKVIPNGWDDTLGKVTCQIRGVGVDCFSKTHHGFIISRTGYAAY